MIVVGGELAATGELLLDPLREAIAATRSRPPPRTSRVVAGELGERAELLGALSSCVGQSDRATDRPRVAASRG